MLRLKNRWNTEGGYREVLVIAIPLILSTATWSVQHFVDRMFLTWYSPETIAAAMPAGMLSFTIISLFMGTAGYVSTFVAQYYGAKRYHRIGPALWQGIYISLFGGLVMLCVIPLAEPAFRLIGHSPSIQEHEVIYFQIMCIGGGAYIGSFALSGFFSGRGKTWPVMWVNAATTVVNLVLDYALIFGHWGFPELGIRGAAIATVVAGVFSLLVFFTLLFSGGKDHIYHTKKGWRFEKDLFGRLLRFGFPSGMQFFLEIAGFTGFVLVVGRLGTAYCIQYKHLGLHAYDRLRYCHFCTCWPVSGCTKTRYRSNSSILRLSPDLYLHGQHCSSLRAGTGYIYSPLCAPGRP
jgi:MATE family multidrug resistance protein